ncbi:MAG: CocE/NonD family hydrolase [Oleiphilaceae bacterium]|nr:CocE/NonD family hydrolase [Oleiphilaceae bacterium]
MQSLIKPLLPALLVLSLSACESDSDTANTTEGVTTVSQAPDNTGRTGDLPGRGNQPRFLPVSHDGLERKDIDGTVVSDDGTVIHFTVFLPDLAPDEAAPIVFQSHGYGGSRLTSLSEDGGDGEFIGNAPAEAAFFARENGAIVVSYDQRGFGESGGQVELMNPEKEGRDFINLLDRIDSEYYEFILRTADDLDPRVGTLGLSYGGGYQWIAGSIDDRVDAMVPLTTWYDLRYSLQPNDVPKTGWLTILQAIGIPGSEGDQSEDIYRAFVETFLPGVDVNEEFAQTLSRHSLRAYCEGFNQSVGGIPKADTLLIQGVADTLFNMRESVDAFECLRQAGRNTHLIVQRLGHILPALEKTPGPTGFATERFLQCGDERYETSRLIFEFVDSRLRGNPEALTLPETCMTIEGRQGITAENIVRGGDLFTTPDRMLQSPEVATAVLAEPELDDSGNLSAEYLERVSPSVSMDLFTADQPLNLAGLPQVSLSVDTLSPVPPTLFLGLKVTRANDGRAILLHNQVTPIAQSGPVSVELPGVTFPLEAGDKVSLVAYTYHPLFYYNDEALQSTTNPTTLTNVMVRLPLLD